MDFKKSVIVVNSDDELNVLLRFYDEPTYIGWREVRVYPLQFIMDDDNTYRLRSIDANGRKRIEFSNTSFATKITE